MVRSADGTVHLRAFRLQRDIHCALFRCSTRSHKYVCWAKHHKPEIKGIEREDTSVGRMTTCTVSVLRSINYDKINDPHGTKYEEQMIIAGGKGRKINKVQVYI
eukprot:gb/GECG01011045.1/.p1 GENE.gb/GECG01011045.1/~~gb/GECG01011045.1/.p1  ORF type:complete len:104 (+),score=2.92 gb/GECG01011045.1/:1-312(+)